MKLRSIRRAFDAAGRTADLLTLFAFVTDHVFVTTAGDVGQVYRLGGPDYEGLDDDARAAHVQRAEAALRVLDDSFRVYQYLVKRRAAGLHRVPLYTVDRYLVVMYERLGAITPPRSVRPARVLPELHAHLAAAIRTLEDTCRGFAAHLSDPPPERLDKHAAFRFLRQLVNDSDHGERLQRDHDLAAQLCNSTIDVHHSHLIVGTTPVRVLTMRDAPRHSFAVMLRPLYELPGEFIACLEWQRTPDERARVSLRNRQRHFWNKRTSILAGLFGGTEAELMEDTSATAMVTQLGAALTDIEAGAMLGDCSLSFAVWGDEAERGAVGIARVLAAHDATVHAETYNALNAWAAMVPGGRAFNLRRMPLLHTNAADLSFVFGIDDGRERDRAGRDPLLTLVTQQQTAYRFHLHVEDVGHTLVLGATGAGKTVAMCAIAEGAQQYAARTYIFDLGTDYRVLAESEAGRVITFGLDAQLNPFDAEGTEAHQQFLHSWLTLLIEGRDPLPAERLSSEDTAILFVAIRRLYALDPAMRRLGTLARSMLPPHLSARLAPWVRGGQYGNVFDVPVGLHLTGAPFQVFEFAALKEFPIVLEPMLFAILHAINARVGDTMTLCLMDEAWRFVSHPAVRDYVLTALKTWRKRNGVMVLATQAVEDFASDLLRTVVESCPTALLLANPGFVPATYRDVFKLNDTELAQLASLRSRGQVLVKRAGRGAKVFDLVIDPHAAWFTQRESQHA